MKGKMKSDIKVEGSGQWGDEKVREGERLMQWGDEMVSERERLEKCKYLKKNVKNNYRKIGNFFFFFPLS